MDISSVESFELESPAEESEQEAEIVLDPDQSISMQAEDVARIAAAAVQNAGLGAVSETFSENQ
eukprot:9760345-Ditylum_brightwellii.AAC.1